MSKLPIQEGSRLQTIVAVVAAIGLILLGAVASRSVCATEISNPMDIFIIVHRGVDAKDITQEMVRDLFLKKKVYWSVTERALAVNSADSALRDDFRGKVLKMTEAEEQRYWRDARVMGTQIEPTAFPNTLQAVFKLKGAVSYVYRKDYREGVSQVVLVIPASAKSDNR